MDFCAGVGGGRLALDNLGMKCVGFSEIDKIYQLLELLKLVHLYL
jgi:site-specific DNA-cytosine methylase